MINDFKNCYIVRVGYDIKPMILMSKRVDTKRDLKYYIFRDVLNHTEHILFQDAIINKISYYIDDEEMKHFIRDEICFDEQLNIIARAIKQERDLLLKDEKEAIKKTLKF